MSQLYARLPKPLKRAAKQVVGLVPLPWRMGRAFHRELAYLEQAQWWSAEQMAALQDERLRALIEHCYEHVPYYRRVMHERGLTPADIQGRGDLPKLPILTKQDVRTHPQELLATNLPPSRRKAITTSGTTGEPLTIYSDQQQEYLMGGPFEWRFYGWGGYRPGMLAAVLRAHYLGDPGGPVFDFNPVQNKIYFSTFLMGRENFLKYVEALQRFRPRHINAYISSMAEFVRLARERDIACPIEVEAIFTIGELVAPRDRQLVEDYFECPVMDWYGMEERVVIACECPERQGHHLNPEFGIMEIIEDETLDTPGAGNVIATGLLNPVMPLVRYDTGDLAAPIEGACPCGRTLPRVRILGGRKRMFLFDHDMRAIPEIGGLLDKADRRVRQYQFVQDEPGRAQLNIVVMDGFNDQIYERIRDECSRALDGRVELSFAIVENIPLTAGGKKPVVLSRITQESST